jgi:flagellar hook-associated protein 1 FlgK
MSLSQALSSALSGLRVTQSGLNLIASNVANAETPGYTRKTLAQVTNTAGSEITGVRVTEVRRQLDIFVQRQMRLELAGAGYASVLDRMQTRLDQVYGTPGGETALDTQLNRFRQSIQSLSTSPDSPVVRAEALARADVLAQHLRQMSADIQSQRSDIEGMIEDAVTRLNNASQRLADVNARILNRSGISAADTAMFDQRDAIIEEIASIIDVRVTLGERGQANVTTNSGVTLVGIEPAVLAFDNREPLRPEAQWSANATERGVGTITLATGRPPIDLIANRSIRSGELAALIEMRDQTLVQAQTQLDEMAAALAQSFSDIELPGSTATAGAQSGFDISGRIADMRAGDSLRVVARDNSVSPPANRVFTFIGVSDPAALPLDNSITPEAGDTVIGIDLSGFGALSSDDRLDAIAAAVGAAPGIGLSVAREGTGSGATLRVLGGTPAVNQAIGASARMTATSLASGDLALPLFVDANGTPFSNAPGTGGVTQTLGFAGRITLNLQVRGNPEALSVHGPGIASGDSSRPRFLQSRLDQQRAFDPRATGPEGSAPFRGSISGFARQIISQQGLQTETTARIAEGQQVVVEGLRARFQETSGVDIDEEMARLISLQTAYGASARVMTTVQQMFETLMRT